MPSSHTIVEILAQRAQHAPHQTAYIFLPEGQIDKAISLTYSQLYQQVLSLAAHLKQHSNPGERALLLYPSGLDYVISFFACLYAGIVAVPAYPPKRHEFDARLQAIMQDCEASLILTTNKILTQFQHATDPSYESLKQTQVLATDQWDDVLDRSFKPRNIEPDTLAFLQYTSGSTGTPKGVMISHHNVISNLEQIKMVSLSSEKTIIINWLPLFHDMGLIHGIMQPVYLNCLGILMPPSAFVQNPFSWLKAISHYRATCSGGPSFCYSLCIEKVTPDRKKELDLACWEVAFNGAEPINPDTITQFIAAFSQTGFRATAMHPCYGMAEATVALSGKIKGEPVIMTETPTPFVSSGKPLINEQLRIVNPENLKICEESEIGEIWASGPNISAGYWNRPEETKETFGGYIAETNEGPFLRTGDLGFMKNNELFVTGRLKDLIIIHGQNFYPQDIEWTVGNLNPAFTKHSTAAFSVAHHGEEKLVVIQEIGRTAAKQLNSDEAIQTICRTISKQYQLTVFAVVLIKAATLPKTSSGKIQRKACKKQYEEDRLSILAQWHLTPRVHIPTTQKQEIINTMEEIQVWIKTWLKEQLEIQEDLDIHKPFTMYGLDSIMVMQLMAAIEKKFDCEFDISQIIECDTVYLLADFIAQLKSPHLKKAALSTAHGSHNEDLPFDPSSKIMDFSLLYFSSSEADLENSAYQLFIDTAKFADEHGFKALWIPERHFHTFGAPYPNPAVLGAVAATQTTSIRIRSGSVVLPLNNPIRVAEEWAMIDNLSQGRVDLGFARGWNPNDFVLYPDHYRENATVMYQGIETIQTLWQGGSVSLPNGEGVLTSISTYPKPIQKTLNVWITATGGSTNFVKAGQIGAHVLTALLFQPIEELAQKIALYRQARAENGYDPGCVTLMLHTYLGEDFDTVKETVREPFSRYIQDSMDLWRQKSQGLEELNEKEKQDVVAYAFEKYVKTHGLFGTPDTCSEMISTLKQIGVDEIACLIDFGVNPQSVMEGLTFLTALKEREPAYARA